MNYSSNFNKFQNLYSGATQYSSSINVPPNTGLRIDQKQYDLMNLAVTISIESGKLLEYTSNKDNDNIKLIISGLKQKLESILSKIQSGAPSNYIAYTGATTNHEFKNINHSEYPGFVSKVIKKTIAEKEEEFLTNRQEERWLKKNDERQLDNGGMAPPKEWKSITELNLKASVKNSLIEEMRKLKEQGQTISSSLYYKKPVTIEEFTEPFNYIENTNDYNGSLFITLLKTDASISNQASLLKIDLKSEKDKCLNNESIILAVFDIVGSTSKGEEKNFLIILNFDKFNGTLEYSHSMFMSGKQVELSARQQEEARKFCKAKKINYS